MRVNYYFRKPHPGVFSIENVFHRVQQYLKKDIEFENFYANQRIDWRMALQIRGLSADVHHVTGAANYLVLGLSPASCLLTVHDVGHLTQTLQGLKRWAYKKLFWDGPLSHVKYITAISNFTRDQLLNTFSLKHAQITTVYNPISDSFQRISKNNDQRFTILQIGGGANKNTDRLVEAVTGLNCHLILIRPFSYELQAKLVQRGVSFEFRSNISSDSALAQTYGDADAVFFASTYEGFGLPIIEGMATGKPVVTSSIEPMREVSGGAALLVDPFQVSEIKNAFINLMSSSELYEQQVQLGLQRAAFFRGERIAGQYQQLYNTIVHEG
ncbi:MAG: glycosyltransferase family 4 protein [Bacteroidetes bacterium]|nr:glycosyltransferase family 4 protein [Bacteroidota bacterium]